MSQGEVFYWPLIPPTPCCCRREASLDLEVKASGFSKDIEDCLQAQGQQVCQVDSSCCFCLSPSGISCHYFVINYQLLRPVGLSVLLP